MPKPNDKSTVKEMKDYIRSNKLKIKLTQKKAELIADLKSTGNWEGSNPATPKTKSPNNDLNSTNKELKTRFVKKIKSFKKVDLEKLLNFNGDALIKVDNNYYGSNNWVMDGVKSAKTKMIDLMGKTTAGFGVGYTDKQMNDLLKIFDNYKTSF